MEAIEKINRQIELELAASSLYKELKVSCDNEELKRLWHTLAVHEEYHATALKRLKNTLSEEELEKEASTLDMDNINSLLASHKEFMEELPAGVSTRRAFEIAMFMEFSELNSLFFNASKSVTGDDSPYIHSMGEGTKRHLMTLFKGMQKFAGDDMKLPYIEKFRELGLITEG
ncbi:MAG: hypothetical protein RQ824_10215 [bacterium]|nr:hypothetical protein [bacterium]